MEEKSREEEERRKKANGEMRKGEEQRRRDEKRRDERISKKRKGDKDNIAVVKGRERKQNEMKGIRVNKNNIHSKGGK